MVLHHCLVCCAVLCAGDDNLQASSTEVSCEDNPVLRNHLSEATAVLLWVLEWKEGGREGKGSGRGRVEGEGGVKKYATEGDEWGSIGGNWAEVDYTRGK